ncbi:MAG: hypothetical protein HY807_09655 [Nitrospirae bacterium]|nr:hypothetical protein [Nitrospirota bacterium]
MLVVCDTGPLLHLAEAKLLDLLQKTGDVYIPEIVDKEMKDLLSRWDKLRPKWVTVKTLTPKELKEAELLFLSDFLDYGEAEAIVLAKRFKADWFVTDDAEARILGKSFGLEVHGSLGVVLWCAALGHLNYKESKAALHALSETSLWISTGVLSEAENALMKIFS